MSQCPPLAEDITLNGSTHPVAVISKTPFSQSPQTEEDLLNDRRVLSSDSVYLKLVGTEGYCAYPVPRAQAGFSWAATHPWTLETALRPEFAGESDLFGLPTSLSVDAAGTWFSGEIWNHHDGLFFAQDFNSAKLFLVGGSKEFFVYKKAILDLSGYLFSLGQQPSLLLLTSPWEMAGDAEFKDVSTFSIPQAYSEIWKLLNWLNDFDPDLLRRMEGKISYDPGEDLSANRTKEINKYTTFAYYSPDQDRIYFLPKIIEVIETGDFRKAAVLLAHELGHRENFKKGKINPHDQIFPMAASAALIMLSENSPYWRVMRQVFGDAKLIEQMAHTVARFNIGEEVHVMDHYELPYLDKVDPSGSDPSLLSLRKEAMELRDYFLQTGRENLPLTFMMLSAIYARRAQ